MHTMDDKKTITDHRSEHFDFQIRSMLKVFKFKMQALRPVLNTRRKTLGENNVMTYISCELFLNTAVFSMIVL